MGISLGLFMVGMSLSPTIAGMFENFKNSFIMALAIFAVSLVYLAIFVPTSSTPLSDPAGSPRQRSASGQSRKPLLVSFWRSLASFWKPMHSFFDHPVLVLPGIAMLFYNAAQAYLFPAIMVHTALRFGFTGTQNGWLISLAAGTSAVYLFSIFFVGPRLKNMFQNHYAEINLNESRSCFFNRDFGFATILMIIQAIALPTMALADESWQVYPIVALIALGLAAPSFMKSYAVILVADGSAAVASFAMMESTGGLLSAILLGSWQSWVGEASVFFAAAGLVGLSVMALTVSLCARFKERV